MPRFVYRKREQGKGGYVDIEDLHDGDSLTDIQALIITLKDMDLTFEVISQIIESR